MIRKTENILKRELNYDDFSQMDNNPNADRNLTGITLSDLEDVNEGEKFIIDNKQYAKIDGVLKQQVLEDGIIIFSEV